MTKKQRPYVIGAFLLFVVTMLVVATQGGKKDMPMPSPSAVPSESPAVSVSPSSSPVATPNVTAKPTEKPSPTPKVSKASPQPKAKETLPPVDLSMKPPTFNAAETAYLTKGKDIMGRLAVAEGKWKSAVENFKSLEPVVALQGEFLKLNTETKALTAPQSFGKVHNYLLELTGLYAEASNLLVNAVKNSDKNALAEYAKVSEKINQVRENGKEEFVKFN